METIRSLAGESHNCVIWKFDPVRTVRMLVESSASKIFKLYEDLTCCHRFDSSYLSLEAFQSEKLI